MLETAGDSASEPGLIKPYVAIEGYGYENLIDDVDMVWRRDEFGSSVAGWNAMAALAFADGADVVHMAADDLEYKKDWDLHVRNIFEMVDGPLILHYRDDYRDEARACNPFINRAYYESFGFLPPELRHFNSDEWLEAMGRLGGCLAYSPSVHIVHMHPKEGRAQWDDTYINPRKPKRRNADAAAWETLQERLRIESAKLRRMVKPPLRLVHSCETPSKPESSQPPSSSEPLPA